MFFDRAFCGRADAQSKDLRFFTLANFVSSPKGLGFISCRFPSAEALGYHLPSCFADSLPAIGNRPHVRGRNMS
jgi:hypothetical protein